MFVLWRQVKSWQVANLKETIRQVGVLLSSFLSFNYLLKSQRKERNISEKKRKQWDIQNVEKKRVMPRISGLVPTENKARGDGTIYFIWWQHIRTKQQLIKNIAPFCINASPITFPILITRSIILKKFIKETPNLQQILKYFIRIVPLLIDQ